MVKIGSGTNRSLTEFIILTRIVKLRYPERKSHEDGLRFNIESFAQ